MEERQVEVIKKVEGPVIRDRRLVGKPLTITRKRVAAYVRVSTNAEEQLQSFKSQKEYYQDKISANKEWALVGIYADEGITGTKMLFCKLKKTSYGILFYMYCCSN